jgi:hypothetical protein
LVQGDELDAGVFEGANERHHVGVASPSSRTAAAAWRCVWLRLALLLKPTLDLVDRYDREHQQHSDHKHWNSDDVHRCGSDRATEDAGATRNLHSSQVGKARSEYQA